MTDKRKCSSRQPASEKKKPNSWRQKFCRHEVLSMVIAVGKAVMFIGNMWQRFKDDPWPFYLLHHRTCHAA